MNDQKVTEYCDWVLEVLGEGDEEKLEKSEKWKESHFSTVWNEYYEDKEK